MSAVSWPEEALCDGDGDGVGVRVAVDVEGELAALERALRLAEQLQAQVQPIAMRRQHAEEAELAAAKDAAGRSTMTRRSEGVDGCGGTMLRVRTCTVTRNHCRSWKRSASACGFYGGCTISRKKS